MIQTDMLHRPNLNYIKKERFTGSLNGLRYAIYKEVKDEEHTVLMACSYPEPFCFEKTPEEQKKYKEFEFSEEGLNEAINWLGSEE